MELVDALSKSLAGDSTDTIYINGDVGIDVYRVPFQVVSKFQ